MSVKKLLTRFGWPLLALPLLLSSLGASLNNIATVSNGGVMPVYSHAYTNHLKYEAMHMAFQLSRKTPEFPKEPDFIHAPATPNTKFHYLCDIFASDGGIYSIGDFVIDLGDQTGTPLFLIWIIAAAYCWKEKKQFNL